MSVQIPTAVKLTDVEWSADGRYVAVAGKGERPDSLEKRVSVTVYDATTGAVKFSYLTELQDQASDPVIQVAIEVDHVAAYLPRQLVAWKLESGSLVQTTPMQGTPLSGRLDKHADLRWTTDERLVSLGVGQLGRAGTYVWEPATGDVFFTGRRLDCASYITLSSTAFCVPLKTL